MLIAVVLAAGRGSRLGGVAKALLRVGQVTFLEAIARAASGVAELVVVVAEPHRDAVAAEAARLAITVVENPDPDRGMASSVAVGFEAIRARAAVAALLWPVDCASVAPATVARIASEAAPDRIVIPTHAGRGGHPAAFGRSIWGELAASAALAEGARSVVRRDPSRVLRIPVDDRGVLADVDLPRDLGTTR